MKLFFFAIGGTGIRVLKSLIMLSAAGVKPIGPDGRPLENTEIVPVIIDPHKSNADLKRTETLLSAYRSIRQAVHGHKVNAQGFFATKISTLRDIMSNSTEQIEDSFIFNLEAVGNRQFGQFIGYDTMNEANQALTALLYAPYQLSNNMNIGFVGSPNIGAVALNDIKNSNEFKAFANAFQQGDRIFFAGSIFGGTGAAGFPILVKNIRQALNIDAKNKAFLQAAPIGSLTVLPYFSLMDSHDPEDRRIDTTEFIIKTRSALEYYNNTLTGDGSNAVNAIFYLGDQGHYAPYEYDPGDIKDQQNPAHLIELIGALAPLKFMGMADGELIDASTQTPLPTKAFEYGLERDTFDVDFTALGLSTRQLIYRPMVKLHLLYLYLRTAFADHIGKGYTVDTPRIGQEFLASEVFRTLNGTFMNTYTAWLHELRRNMRHVTLFADGISGMAEAINGVQTRKGLFGHKSVDPDVFKSQMNSLSRDNQAYANASPAYKLLDLFYQAAEHIITERYSNIN